MNGPDSKVTLEFVCQPQTPIEDMAIIDLMQYLTKTGWQKQVNKETGT